MFYADFQFPILPWEDGSTRLTTRFGFIEPCVHAVCGQAGVKSAHGVAACARKGIRVGVAEEDTEGAGRHKDELGKMKDEFGLLAKFQEYLLDFCR